MAAGAASSELRKAASLLAPTERLSDHEALDWVWDQSCACRLRTGRRPEATARPCVQRPGVWDESNAMNGVALTLSAAIAGLLTPLLGDARAARGVGPLPATLADILPPGHRAIKHELVFVESDLLSDHRLIATPTRGLRGAVEVKAGQPFSFSTKYGTRLYIAPDDAALPENGKSDVAPDWLSAEPPIHDIRSVPWYSPVESALTTCRLAAVGPDGPQIDLVEHVTLDAQGRPASGLRRTWLLAAIAAVGLLGCLGLYIFRRVHKSSSQQPAAP